MAALIDVNSAEYKIGQKVFEARKASGMSQMALAEASGLERKTICRIENGNGTYFSNIISIAQATGRTPNDFCPEGSVLEKNREQDFYDGFSDFECLNAANKDIVRNLMRGLLAAQG